MWSNPGVLESAGRAPGAYVHIPFCSAICPYCDFAVTLGDGDRREMFVRALLAEIRREREFGGPFDTIYLGGGTPSALEQAQLGRILEALRSRLSLIDGATISIEANPEDVSDQNVREWKALGIERLSLGIQSFDSKELDFLGRRHDPSDARRAVEVGLAAGAVVSMDLIYGLPGQSPASWQHNLELAVALAPQHISCYQLTVEPGTPFAVQRGRGDWRAPANEAVAELFFRTHEFLGASGYPAYEVSNFARGAEHQCAHNRKYWEHVPYLGFGPSAHSFDGRSRWWNQRAERAWRLEVGSGRNPIAGREDLTVVDLALEKIMLGLRTPAGVDLHSLAGIETSAFLERNSDVLSRSVERGLLDVGSRRLVPTLAGMAQADALARAIRI